MSVEKNLEVSTKYHDLDPDNVDEILALDFKGEHWGVEHTWEREGHRKYLSNRNKTDTIHEQFGSGDRVCTRFTRITTTKDGDRRMDCVQIKQFRDGKIAHIWETVNVKQIEEQQSGT